MTLNKRSIKPYDYKVLFIPTHNIKQQPKENEKNEKNKNIDDLLTFSLPSCPYNIEKL